MVSSGYTAGVSTSIEQRYSLRSSEIGTIISAGDIGSLSTVVFVSWFGGNGNRPRWVAAGGFLVVLGSVLFALPQLISENYEPSGTDPNSIDGDLCQANYSTSEDCLNVGPKNSLIYFVFLLANVIIGMGGSPIFTLGKIFESFMEIYGFYQARHMYMTQLQSDLLRFTFRWFILSEQLVPQQDMFLLLKVTDFLGSLEFEMPVNVVIFFEMSRNFSKCLKMSLDVSKYLEMSENIKRVHLQAS